MLHISNWYQLDKIHIHSTEPRTSRRQVHLLWLYEEVSDVDESILVMDKLVPNVGKFPNIRVSVEASISAVQVRAFSPPPGLSVVYVQYYFFSHNSSSPSRRAAAGQAQLLADKKQQGLGGRPALAVWRRPSGGGCPASAAKLANFAKNCKILQIWDWELYNGL